jgi:hypothetical protein
MNWVGIGIDLLLEKHKRFVVGLPMMGVRGACRKAKQWYFQTCQRREDETQ